MKMPKKSTLTDFDRIVQEQVQKSVVTAPSDPNGGAKLPKRQKDAPKRKEQGKTQYMAVFDRESGESDDQLDDWMDETNEMTGSPEDFVNDDDDTASDPDDLDDDRNDDVYDPYDDDDELDLSDGDEDYVNVRGHKRRKIRKSNADEEDEFDELPDENDDDDLDENDDDDEHDDDCKCKDCMSKKNRRKKIRKALGADAMKYVDGSPLVKALIDRIEDMNDNFIAEVRALRSENRQLKKMIKNENRQMAKALVTSQAQFAGFSMEQQAAPIQQQSQPIRKGYGLPVQTTQRPVPQEFNLAKSLDVLEDAFQKGLEGVSMRDITILENDRSPLAISNAAQEVLRKNKLL